MISRRRSLELVKDVLGIVKRLWFDQYAFLVNLLQDCKQVLLDLLLDSLLKLCFNILTILEPLQLLIATLYDLIFDKILYSLVNSSLQSSQVNLLLTEQLKQSLLLLKPVSDHVSIAVTLVHALSKQLLVLRTALGDPLEDSSPELVSLLDHLGSVRHLLLVSSFLLFLPFLV